jgi:hypothetical protein
MDLWDELEQVLDKMDAADPFSLSDPASIKRAHRLRNKFDSVSAKVMLGFEDSGEWAPDGARSSVGWVAKECLVPAAQVRAELRRAKLLEKAPLVAQAFASGEIGAAQVDLLVPARRQNEACFERDEAILVGQATSLKFGAFVAAVKYWGQLADPDGAEEAEFTRADRRDVWLTESISGMYLGKMNLDPYAGSAIYNELVRLEAILFEADWAEAKERLGREPTVGELRRTPAQRRADALLEMARRSASTPADAQRPEPLITILVGYETFLGRICQIEGGPAVSPGSVVHQMCSAWFERIVFKPKGRIECSEKARFFAGGTRRAIEVRDRECSNDYCENPHRRLQIDHIIPYSKGGLTTQANGQVLCAYCNRKRGVDEPPWGRPEPPGG